MSEATLAFSGAFAFLTAVVYTLVGLKVGSGAARIPEDIERGLRDIERGARYSIDRLELADGFYTLRPEGSR